jgi:uncharacterized protein (DUF2141 family)
MIRFATFATALALAFPAAALAGPVSVDLSGLRAGGALYVQLQTRAQFMGAERVAGRIVAAPAAGSLSLDLGDVPPGDYAITIWHNDNGNHLFDMDPSTGAPADGWATVNGEALSGRPAFDQIRFAIPAEGLRVPLVLHYGR